MLRKIDAACFRAGTASHTTPRFRYELLYYLLDNEARGPIIEVGTMNGGLTALFGYVALLTGRKVFAVDLMAPQIEITKATCYKAGTARNITFFTGDLAGFLASGLLAERPDLSTRPSRCLSVWVRSPATAQLERARAEAASAAKETSSRTTAPRE